MSSKASTSRNLRKRSRSNPSTTTTSKKSEREIPAPSSPEPKRRCIGKKSHDGRDIDRYCWLCHQSDADSQQNICITCPRVYHTSCLEKASSEFNDKNVCPECQMESVNGLEPSKSLDVQKLRKLLLATTERKISESKFKSNKLFYSWPPNIGDSDIVKVVDFEILLDKINDSTPYTKTSEFFSDLKWICHNVIILFGPTSDMAGAAIKVVKAFKTDLMDLEACPDCYARMLVPNDPNFFVNICEPPHDIIWAKVKGYPYWPAKCLKTVNGVAHVRFFETHDLGDVPLNQCYHISKKHPNLPPRLPPKTVKYKRSLAELYEYVHLYEEKYGKGSFHFYDEMTAYIPTTPPPLPVINSLIVPTNPKANIRLLTPIHIDLAENERNDQPPTLAESSDGVTVNMTFSEEQNRNFNELESSEPLTSDDVQTIDLRTGTETFVSQSIPNFPVIDLSEMNDLGQVDDSLHVNGSQRNETVVNIDESFNIESVISNNLVSEATTQNASTAEDVTYLGTWNSNHVPSMSTNSSGQFEAMDSTEPLMPSTDANVTASNIIDILPSIFNQPPVDEEIGPSSTNAVGVNGDWRSHAHSFLKQVQRSNSPIIAEFFSLVFNKLETCITNYAHLQTENSRLRVAHQSVLDKAAKEMQGLKDQLQNLQEKYKMSLMELEDVTHNARYIVESTRRSANMFWTARENDYKEELEACMKKLAEKKNLIAEIEAQRDSVRSSLHELENRYQEAPIEKLSTEAQTDLKSAGVFLKKDYETRLEQTKQSREKEMLQAIREAKREICCISCTQPANIHCCMLANYCSQTCQENDAESHSECCQREREIDHKAAASQPTGNRTFLCEFVERRRITTTHRVHVTNVNTLVDTDQ